ncbi:MAG: response regulator [archaeon]
MVKTIFLVDDEKHLVELVTAILESEKFKVITASNGIDALAKLKKWKPDLMLLDMMMPGMSGIEVCEKIRADPKLKDLKIIPLSVVASQEIGAQKLKELNLPEYITKPFNNSELVRRIKKILLK